MAVVPVIISGVFYPKGKAAGDKPMAGTLVGNSAIAGLGVGGGPIDPPPDIHPYPPLVIWGGPIDPYPDIGFPIGPPGGPPPTTVTPPHEGWNWSAAKSGWYYLHVPGPGEAQPKK
jgi:hypothetical protein